MENRKQGGRKPAHEERRPPKPAGRDKAAALAGGIAHDFNNILTIVRTYAALLREELEGHSALPHVEQLQAATHRMAQVVKQLQAFSGGLLIAPTDVQPGDLVRRLSDTLKHVVIETVELRVAIQSTAVVCIDPTQLERAVVALLLYVADSVPEGGRIWLNVSDRDITRKEGTAAPGRYVEIRIASSANALSADERRRLFKPGFRLERGATGADLRLASIAGMLKQSGGSISTPTERDRGIVFSILLPIVERGVQKGGSIQLARERELHGHEVVLVVEDDVDVRRTVRDSLERYGYSVIEAADGADALRMIDLLNGPPDLLLTDVVMPEVGGRELVDVLRRENKLPKVLLMSGYIDETLQRAMPDVAHPFIPKPFTHDELAARVREVLETD